MKYSTMVELTNKLNLAIKLLEDDCIHREECGINARKIRQIIDQLEPIRGEFVMETQYIIDRFMEANNFGD